MKKSNYASLQNEQPNITSKSKKSKNTPKPNDTQQSPEDSSSDEEEEAARDPTRTAVVNPMNGETLYVGDMVKMAAITILSTADRKGTAFEGLGKRFREHELWNKSFDAVLKKYASISVTQLSPEAALAVSTGMVFAQTFAINKVKQSGVDLESLIKNSTQAVEAANTEKNQEINNAEQ